MESKQAAQSVIAKLMGLDELPPQQPVQKKPRVLSQNYLQRVASIGVREKHSGHNLCSLSSEEQKDTVEVFQILETLKRHKRRSTSIEKRKLHLSSSEAKVLLREEEVRQLKHVSKGTNLQRSKGCHAVPEIIDSETGNSPKKFRAPEFGNKANDVHYVNCHSQSGLITVRKPLRPDCRGNCRKSWRPNEQGCAQLLRKLEEVPATYSFGEVGLDNTYEVLGSHLGLNDGTCLPTTRIVVLKTNPEKVQHTSRYFPSTCSSKLQNSSSDRKHREILITQDRNLYAEVKEKKNFSSDLGPAGSRSRVSKEIRRSMAYDVSSMSREAQTSEIRGSNTLTEESESMMHSSPVFSDGKNQCRQSDGSYLTQEAKKRISERWKTTKNFQQVELVSGSKTLGEMLAVPDCELKPINFVHNLYNFGLSNEVSPGSEDVNARDLSNWGGCKDRHIRDSPNSTSLGNFNAVTLPKTMSRHKSLQNGSNLKRSRALDPNLKDGLECGTTDHSCKDSPLIPYLVSENNHSVEAKYALQDEMEIKIEVEDSHGKISVGSSGQNHHTLQDPWMTWGGHKYEGSNGDLSEHNSEVCKSPSSSVSSMNMVAGKLAVAGTEASKRSMSYQEVHNLEPDNCFSSLKDEYSPLATSDQQEISNRITEFESVSSQCSVADGDPESAMSLEEGYQPSPDSVLEPLFRKEISSNSLCFDSVGASLHDLRGHLELLKSEASDTYSEGSGMMVSSDEEAGEGSVDDSEENNRLRFFRAEESRDFSYLVDVVSEAGFHNRKPQMGSNSWHCEEYPISSSVFETLEKKYGEHISWKRSERRLLFDRINTELTEILQPSMGMPTWKRLVVRRLTFGLSQEMIEEELWMLLIAKEKEAGKESEKVLGKDDRWLDLSDDVQFISIEIENSLMDELVADVSMEIF